MLPSYRKALLSPLLKMLWFLIFPSPSLTHCFLRVAATDQPGCYACTACGGLFVEGLVLNAASMGLCTCVPFLNRQGKRRCTETYPAHC